jgi:hypothetical protein
MYKSLSSISTSSKWLLLGIVVIILLAVAAGGWTTLRWVSSEAVIDPILKISYCGADPEALCVLSFGRDLDEHMIINLFVPDRKFPEFYLKIKRAAAESIYMCVKNSEVPTSVYCSGELIGLQEKMEINLISKEDDHLMAAGKLTLLAVLLSSGDGGVQVIGTPSVSFGSDNRNSTATATAAPFSTEMTVTSTPVFVIYTATATPTFVSYP